MIHSPAATPRRLAVALLVALGALLVPAAPARAGALFDALKSRQARLDALLAESKGSVTPAVRERIEDALAGLMDFAAMGRESLGPQWSRRTPEEQKRFLAAFEALVRASSVRRVEVYQADSVSYLEEQVDGTRGHALTTVKSKSALTEVRYDFERRDGDWQVVDWTIDGASTVGSYKRQFAKLLEKRGFDGLVERIETRARELRDSARAGTGKEPDRE